MEKHECQEMILSDGWHKNVCSNKAKVERDGKWYCGIHDPVKIAEKRTIRDEQWDRAYKLSEEKYERKALMFQILKNKSMDELREMAKLVNK